MFPRKKDYQECGGLSKSLKKYKIKQSSLAYQWPHTKPALTGIFPDFFFLKTQLLIPKLMGIVLLDSKNSRVG